MAYWPTATPSRSPTSKAVPPMLCVKLVPEPGKKRMSSAELPELVELSAKKLLLMRRTQ